MNKIQISSSLNFFFLNNNKQRNGKVKNILFPSHQIYLKPFLVQFPDTIKTSVRFKMKYEGVLKSYQPVSLFQIQPSEQISDFFFYLLHFTNPNLKQHQVFKGNFLVFVLSLILYFLSPRVRTRCLI